MPNQVSVSKTAPGKVNLFFAVGAVQPNGYHPVASLYSAVSLNETVTVSEGSVPGISLSVEIAPDSLLARMEEAGDFDRLSVPLDSSNLAYRAAEAVLVEQGLSAESVSLHLQIDKQVPVAGGMAGGSADAAAALKAVNAYLASAGFVDSEISFERLLELGAGLGADVPFCLMGGLAVGYGVGEELTSVEVPASAEPLHLVMVLNDRGLSTPAVFRELDAARAAGRVEAPAELLVPQDLVDSLVSSQMNLESVVSLISNDLQSPAVSLAPELAETLALGSDSGLVIGSVVSGSGPTVALVAKNKKSAQLLVAELTSHGKYAVAVTTPTI